MSKNEYAIGIDLGGTKLAAALVDNQGVIHKKLYFSTQVKEGAEGVKQQIIDAVRDLQSTINEAIIGIGVGVAGQIEAQTGMVKFAPNLNWHNVPLQKDLKQALNLPVVITNDVRAATYGEWLYGAGRDCYDLICLFIGTGIGSGIVSGGKMLSGCSNTCGEVGHMTVDLHGPLCTCGNHGCLEALAGGWGVAKRAQEAVQKDPQAGEALLQGAVGKMEAITAKLVGEMAKAKNPLALQLMEQSTEALIAGCANLINAFNPCRLILGGGLIEGNPEMVSSIEKGVHRRALKAAVANLQVVSAELHQSAGLIGGATLAMQTFASKGRL